MKGQGETLRLTRQEQQALLQAVSAGSLNTAKLERVARLLTTPVPIEVGSEETASNLLAILAAENADS